MGRLRKVFIIHPNAQYVDMFMNHPDYMVVDNIIGADMLQFTGGSDVTPSYYGEKSHPATYNNPDRDEMEAILFKAAFGADMPMAGICRGAQFLHVMNSGKLYQHVYGHCGVHMVRDVWTDKVYKVSSTHHQMMRDSWVEDGVISKILAVAENVSEWKESMASGHVIRSREWPVFDLEAIYFPITNTLCFQPHPEFDGYEDCRSLYFQYLDEYLFNTE